MTRFFLFLLIISLKCTGTAQAQFKLEPFITGLSEPVDITNAGDDRLFVVEKKGIIRIITPNGQVLTTPFLDIDSKVSPSSGEQGLLGLAFHPNYAQNGYFFVNYTDNNGDTRIERYRANPPSGNTADPNSALPILFIDQPYANHNGGDLSFGPDGYLYIGMGDGGSAGDPQNRAQNRKNLLGKMLRIDINNGNPYSIPPTNPFVNDTANYRPEIWALGLRNPWRFSFDRQTGDLWIGDVGQGNWEEIHLQAAASKGGENYGWRCYEGNADYNTSGCNAKNTYTFPVYAYSHSSNNDCSITGGYLYRGIKYPALQGTYIYTDYCSGLFRALRSNGQGGWTNTDLVKAAFGFVTFGEDKNGELYVANANNGTIYQIIGSTTATKDVLQIGNLTLAPNPAADFIRISMDALETGTYQFRLLDATGRALSEWREGVATGYVKDIATKELPVGLYFLQVQKDGQTLTRKFQKGG